MNAHEQETTQTPLKLNSRGQQRQFPSLLDSSDAASASISRTTESVASQPWIDPQKSLPHFPAEVGEAGPPKEPSLWLPLAARTISAAIILFVIAWIGHRSEDLAMYGPLLARFGPDPVPADVADHSEHALPSEKMTPTLASTGSSGASGGAPSSSQTPLPEPPPCPRTVTSKPSGITSDGKVILNEANAQELTRLPGVGQSRADAIVELRARLKRFRKLTDLLRVRGIGYKTLQKMRDQLVLDRPEQSADEAPSREEGSPPRPSGQPTAGEQIARPRSTPRQQTAQETVRLAAAKQVTLQRTP